MKNLLSFQERFILRRNVVRAALSGCHPDAVATEFGVSRASVYNWMREDNEGGSKKLLHAAGDKRFSFPGMTAFETLRFIRQRVLRDPEMSADNVAKFMNSWGYAVSPRTMRNCFKRLGFSSAIERRKKAYDWRNTGSVAEISDEELLEIMSSLEDLPPGELKGSRPGQVLLQDRIKLPKGYCDEELAIELIVDTFSPMRRIFAKLGAPCDQLSLDALSTVQATYTDQGFKIYKICTPRKQQYEGDLGAFIYPKWFDKHLEKVLEVRPANSKTADSRIKEAWSYLKSGWLKTLLTRLPRDGLRKNLIEEDLQLWLVALQNQRVGTFPYL